MTCPHSGEGLDRAALQAQFKTLPRCVLFGRHVFWQGVDVPGDKFSNVFIVRLPICRSQPTPDSGAESTAAGGGNHPVLINMSEGHSEIQTGSGRLIRRKTDQGNHRRFDRPDSTEIFSKHFLQTTSKVR
jgi:ATP-dependent DNA helicase DinG